MQGVRVPALPSSPRRESELFRLFHSRELIRHLVATDLRSPHVGTALGRVWWVLDPLLLMLIYVLLVKVIFHRGGADYPVFVFTGVLAWKFFSSGVTDSMGQTVGKQQLMKEVVFPRAALPMAAVLAEVVNFCAGLVVLLALAAGFGIVPSFHLAFLPLIAAVQLLFTLGFGFAFAALNVFFRDVGAFMSHILRLWFYLSPGLYSASALPKSARTFYPINPFATILPAYRDVIMQHQMPPLAALGFTALAGVAVLIVGYMIFARLQHEFPKVL